jgi:hypothetical protein
MLAAIVLAHYHVWLSYAWRWNEHKSPFYWDPVLAAWEWGVVWYAEILFPMAVWVALSLGAVSVGREYRSGAMPFLLTRPASRRAFVWTDWSLGLVQMTVILAMMLVGLASVLRSIGNDYVWLGFPQLLECVVLGAALYGLAHFTTALVGSSMKGLSVSVAVILIYELLPGALQEWWRLDGPVKFRDWSLNLWGQAPGITDPFTLHGWPMLMWLMVALAFPLLSQFVLERREG